MIYVITGRDRSGTSMLTRAMHVLTGLPVVRDLATEAIIKTRVNPDYPDDPNPNGYYQAGTNFPDTVSDDCVIKVPMYRWGAVGHVANGMHIVWTERDEAERQQSMALAFRDDSELMVPIYEQMEAELPLRNDIVSLTKVTFANCLDYPVAILDQLRDNGWPIPAVIDGALLADLFNVDLWRNRL